MRRSAASRKLSPNARWAASLDPRHFVFRVSSEVRRVIDTTTALVSVHAQLRKVINLPLDHAGRPGREAMSPLALRYQARFAVRTAQHGRS
jgi:hypothetical protein